MPAKPIQPDTSGTFSPERGYTLSDAERALDCKKLSGRMQVRILQIRGGGDAPATSEIARGAQSVSGSILGGSTYGVDPGQQAARDRAILEAYNAELARKGCPTFDLAAELASSDNKHTPRPRPQN